MSDLAIGSDFEYLNPTIDGTPTEVVTTTAVRAFKIKVRGGNIVYHKKKSTSTTYGTIYPRSAEVLEMFLPTIGSSLGFFWTASGNSEVLEITVIY